MPRFMRKGVAKFFFVPTIADEDSPTAAEVNAGIRISTQLAEVNGFTFANSPIKTPDMETAYSSQIGGEDESADSSMKFYELRDATNPIKTALAKNTDGFVVSFPEGIAGAIPAVGDDCEVWPVTVTSNAREYTVANESAMYNVAFAVTSPPTDDAVVA